MNRPRRRGLKTLVKYLRFLADDDALKRHQTCIHGSPLFDVLLHLYLHPLTQNDQIRHDKTYGGSVFRRSATPLYLRRFDARFVSDS